MEWIRRVRILRAARGLDRGLAHPGAENARALGALPLAAVLRCWSDSASASGEAEGGASARLGAAAAAAFSRVGIGEHHAAVSLSIRRPGMVEETPENAKPFRFFFDGEYHISNHF